MSNYPDGFNSSLLNGGTEYMRHRTCGNYDVDIYVVEYARLREVIERLNNNDIKRALVVLKEITKTEPTTGTCTFDGEVEVTSEHTYEGTYEYWTCPYCDWDHEDYTERGYDGD